MPRVRLIDSRAQVVRLAGTGHGEHLSGDVFVADFAALLAA
jgi:hypothetical protein